MGPESKKRTRWDISMEEVKVWLLIVGLILMVAAFILSIGHRLEVVLICVALPLYLVIEEFSHEEGAPFTKRFFRFVTLVPLVMLLTRFIRGSVKQRSEEGTKS